MEAHHQSPVPKAETHNINNIAKYQLRNSDYLKVSKEQIKQLSQLSKLSKLHLKGEFKEGNWFH